MLIERGNRKAQRRAAGSTRWASLSLRQEDEKTGLPYYFAYVSITRVGGRRIYERGATFQLSLVNSLGHWQMNRRYGDDDPMCARILGSIMETGLRSFLDWVLEAEEFASIRPLIEQLVHKITEETEKSSKEHDQRKTVRQRTARGAVRPTKRQ